MKAKKQKKKLKISWRIFISLAVFTIVIIALLWLFQVVFLNDIYSFIKNQDIKAATESVSDNYNEKVDLTEYINSVATQEDVCIMVITSNGGALYNCHNDRDCVIHKLSNNLSNLIKIYDMTVAAGGTYFESFRSGFDAVQPGNKDYAKSNVVSSKIVNTVSSEPVCVIVNSTVVPVTATVDTLNIQLIFITIIMLILAIVMAFLISRGISKPIAEMSNSARELSKGNYDVQFSTKGDQEISELGETLNFTASELSKVDQYRKDLIANISHDMRTPLTMITGYGEVMRDIPGENNAENIQIIIDEANRLSVLVNDALDISKLQSGKMEAEFSCYSLTESVNSVVERYRKMVSHNGYNISFEYSSNVFVNADQIKISQVIYNLLTNAINYTGENKQVIVRQLADQDAGIVRIEFEDFGEGIPKEQFHNIWDRYYKIDKTHKRGTVGTGLGLSIVRNILELHHARYGLRSTLGRGSVFWFELPLYKQ